MIYMYRAEPRQQDSKGLGSMLRRDVENMTGG